MSKDLTLELQDKLREDLYGRPKFRTVEEALQEALDDTTPEEPGVPGRDNTDPSPPQEDEWI